MSICDYKNPIPWKDKDLGKFVDETVDDLKSISRYLDRKKSLENEAFEELENRIGDKNGRK